MFEDYRLKIQMLVIFSLSTIHISIFFFMLSKQEERGVHCCMILVDNVGILTFP